MLQTNFLSMVFTLLEEPVQINLEDEILLTICRAEAEYFEEEISFSLVFYGLLGETVFENYETDDRLFIEGSIKDMWINPLGKIIRMEINILNRMEKFYGKYL